MEVTWLAKISRVRGVAAAIRRGTNSPGSKGRGRVTRRSTAPARSHTTRSVASQAPYSWSVLSTSSPGDRRSERATMFTPVVAFGTKTRSSADAPTKAASRSRARRSKPAERRPRKATGLRSSSRCHRW